MSATDPTYQRILSYLKGILSNRQRHDLEKEMMQDAFDEEAFEGLSQFSAETLESDMELLANRLHNSNQAKSRNFIPFYRMAAALLLLIGVGMILYYLLKPPAPELVAEKPVTEKQPSPAVTSPPSVAETINSPGQVPEPVLEPVQQTTISPSDNRQDVRDRMESIPSKDGAEVSARSKSAVPAVNRQHMESQQVRGIASAVKVPGIITGKVTDMEGEALPGVIVREKGNSRGTLTNMDGSFSLQLGDTGSKLALSSSGYTSREMNAGEVSGKEVILQENKLDQEEVVVVSYGAGEENMDADAPPQAKGELSGDIPASYNFTNPVPPEGSLKAFKSWVMDRVDTTRFQAYPGKHKMWFILDLQADGYISKINVRSLAPAEIIDEYRRVIALSPVWEPALQDEIAVESEVVIRFVVTVE